MTTPADVQQAGFSASSDESIMRQAEILALRSLGDQVNALGATMNGLRSDMKEFSSDMREVREKVVAIEGAEISARLDKEILRLEKVLEVSRLEARRVEDAMDREDQNLHTRITNLAMSYSRFTGTVAPLGALGLVIFTAIVSFIASYVTKGP